MKSISYLRWFFDKIYGTKLAKALPAAFHQSLLAQAFNTPTNLARKGLIFTLSLGSTALLTGQQFVAVQEEAGLTHVTSHSAFLGGGGAFLDYDNDGDEDIYLIGGQEKDQLFENNGDGTFTDRTTEAGLFPTSFYYTTGVTAGDIDNDGDTDLFVTTWFGDTFDKNVLLRNNGNGTFSDIWIQLEEEDQVFSMGATLIDFDLDGLLDIYVINYVDEAQFTYNEDNVIVGFEHTCYANRFYHNLGGGFFEDITDAVGLGDTGCALAVASTDYDMDGDIDLYLANDFGEFIQPNRLFRNNFPDLTFTEVGMETGADLGMYGMGIAIGDIDQDLDLDYYVTNFGRNALLRNDGGSFSDITDESGVADTWDIQDSLMAVGWGTALLDIDNDSDLDLYVANGYVPSPNFIDSRIFIADRLFRNDGQGSFTDISSSSGVDNSYVTRGLTYADYDNDGDLDVLAIVLNVPVNEGGWNTVLYNNQEGNQQNWLQVSLEGIEANRSAFGAKVFVYLSDKTLLHEISGGASHASQLSSRAHFGLGAAEVIDSVQIQWPGGFRKQMVYDLDINQHYTIIEDTSIVIDTVPIVRTTDLAATEFPLVLSPNPTDGTVRIATPLHPDIKFRSIRIVDMAGQQVFYQNADIDQLPVVLDLQHLAVGTYLLQLELATSEKVISRLLLKI